MSLNTQSTPSFLKEFRLMKLKSIIRDLHKMNPDELAKIQKELDHLLHSSKK
ncbi:hypothetical protein GCM10011571_21310 [Marinithermofilum abyssi]|jgi:hypothetical protein|uniref:Uncharacterized protein n=1 Tax=Marinithermofilum abyssi TaxID=1571185 RepID=A0A8J2YDQ2_9BACL|nr:hypothetical protein GCM10011571_21310 [Marinithermofilum abyssi]